MIILIATLKDFYIFSKRFVINVLNRIARKTIGNSIFKKDRIRSKIAPNGFWIGYNDHHIDNGIINSVFKIISLNNFNSLIDFGSGSQALYSKSWKKLGVKEVTAVDGNPQIKSFFNWRLKTFCFDLTNIWNKTSADICVCLEVGEHIPPMYEDMLWKNISFAAKKKLVISWAIPGQGGHGHVNEKPNLEIIQTAEKFGFTINNELTQLLRQNITECKWFENTIFCFDKTE
jgi:hypothetical protein